MMEIWLLGGGDVVAQCWRRGCSVLKMWWLSVEDMVAQNMRCVVALLAHW